MFDALGPTIAFPIAAASLATAFILAVRLRSIRSEKIAAEQKLAELQSKYEAEIRWRSATERFELSQRSLAHIAVNTQAPVAAPEADDASGASPTMAT